MPKNCPNITWRGKRLGVKKRSIKTNVSSILEAMKAVIPATKWPMMSIIVR